MQIDIQTRGFTLTEGLRNYCERRMRFALGPGSSRLSAVSVRLADVNGPRGGVDKRVMIKATLPGVPPMVVGHDEPDIYVAIDRAAGRISRAVTQAAAYLAWPARRFRPAGAQRYGRYKRPGLTRQPVFPAFHQRPSPGSATI